MRIDDQTYLWAIESMDCPENTGAGNWEVSWGTSCVGDVCNANAESEEVDGEGSRRWPEVGDPESV